MSEPKPKKKSRATSVQEGEQLRGWVCKLYPTQEQLHYLGCCQAELMAAWNVLVLSRQTMLEHCVRYCEDHGLIGPVPPRPMSDRETNLPDEIAEWEAYETACGLRRFEAVGHTRQVEGLTWDDWRVDYRTLRNLFGGRHSIANAQMYLSLTQTFQKTKGARFKRIPKKMPLLNRTGGTAVRIVDAHHAVVAFGPARIKARYWYSERKPQHRTPLFIQGIAIKLHSDGWYASAKCRVVPTPLAKPTKEIIAVNPGLECLYADHLGHVIANPRGNAYSLQVREMSDAIDAAPDPGEEAALRNRQHRHQERFELQTEHLIYNEVLLRLAPYDTILLGESTQGAAQGRQARISRNDEGGYVSAMSRMCELITQRYGLYHPDDNPTGRVRVVRSAGMSCRCSQCGTEHATRYQRSNLRREDQITDCQTPHCRARIHVDVNHARNLLANYMELQAAAE